MRGGLILRARHSFATNRENGLGTQLVSGTAGFAFETNESTPTHKIGYIAKYCLASIRVHTGFYMRKITGEILLYFSSPFQNCAA